MQKRTNNWRVIGLFLGPALAAYLLLTVYPVLLTIYNSLFEIRPREASTFIAWRNYTALATDKTFWLAVKHTVLWAIVAPISEVVIGLLLALGLYARVPFGRLLRIAWFSPVLISYVVVAIMWSWLYNYDWGVINIALRTLGLGELQKSWLGEPDFALAALMVVDVWKWTPFHMVVCLAALQGLPSEVLEAAELDTCGWLKKLWFIVVPMISPTLLGLLVLGFIGKMKVFDLVWLMTQGGPLWATETVSTYVYKRAFDWNTFDLGYPSAIATVWFIAILICVILFTTLMRQRDTLEY